jgi:hypothetical protein
MPTYTIALAHDTSFYGLVGAEGDTWEEAVASLTSDDWSECFEEGDGGWEQQQRVVHVEDEDGNIVAEDIAFYCPMIHRQSVIQRLREIQIAADLDAALALYHRRASDHGPRPDLQEGEHVMTYNVDTENWEPVWYDEGPEHDPKQRLLAHIRVAGCDMHLEAIEVYKDKGGINTPMWSDFTAQISLLEGCNDCAFRTTDIGGRTYVLIATPYGD